MRPTDPPETFAEHCHREQALLDQNLADVEFLSLRQSYFQAAIRFGELRHRLEEHIQTEEQFLLPLLVQHTGDPDGIAARIREDHRRLSDRVDAVAVAISQWDRAAFVEQVANLRAALKVHHEDEEARLHPLLSDVVRTAADWRLLCQTPRAPS